MPGEAKQDGEGAAAITAPSFMYRAFISYRHTDRAWGDWLHRALEEFRVPKPLVGTLGDYGPVPARLGRVFRDREELGAAHDLGEEIQQALADSAALVVICSPGAAQSRWVNEEILAYKRLGRETSIYAIIVDGEPHAKDPAQECFPPALKFDLDADGNLGTVPSEPIAADARKFGDGRQAAKLKLIAGLLGVQYYQLKRRDMEAQRRRLVRLAAITAAVALIVAVLSFVAIRQAMIVEETEARAAAESDRARDEKGRVEGQLKENQRSGAALVARQSDLASKEGMSELALALAVESVRLAQASGGELPRAALAALQHAATFDNIVSVLADPSSALAEVAFGADPDVIFTRGEGGLSGWNALNGAQRAYFGTRDAPVVTSVTDAAGRFLIVLYGDRSLQIYDADTFETLGDAIVFNAGLVAAAIDDGGRELVVADETGTIHFIDPVTQRPLASGKAHDAPVGAIAVAADRSIAVTGDETGKAVIWNLGDHTQRAVIRHGAQESAVDIASIAISPDGGQLALSGGGWVSVHDSAGAELRQLSDGRNYIGHFLYAPDGKHAVYAAGKDVYAARLPGFEIEKTFSGNGLGVRGLALSRDGRRMLIASRDNVLRLWDFESTAMLRLYRPARGAIGGYALSADGNYLAAIFDDGNAVVWAVEGLSPIAARFVQAWNINSIVWSNDGAAVLIAGGDGRVTAVDVETNHLIFSISSEAEAGTSPPMISNAVYTPDGTGIVTADERGSIRLYAAATGEAVRLIGQLPENYPANWVVMTPDGKQMIVARYGGLGVYDAGASNGREQRAFMAPNVALFVAAISPDGTRVASGAADGRVFIWDFASGKLLVERREDRSQINAVNFSPDGKYLVTASSDRTVRVWTVATGSPELLLSGHDDPVLWAAYSGDGQRIASAGTDGAVKVWDAATGAELLRYPGSGKPFRAAVFDPLGTTLAAGGDDLRLYLWRLPDKNFANTPTSGPILKSQLDADDRKLLKEMLSWTPLTLSKPLTSQDRRENYLPVDAKVRVFAASADACDRLAALPADPQRLAPGIYDGFLSGGDAEEACRAALAAHPDEARFHLQLGRALLAQGNADEGRREIQLAVDARYLGAVFYLGSYLAAQDDADAGELRHGFDLLRKAWELGVADAGDVLARNIQTGRKAKDGSEVVARDEEGALDLFRQASARGAWQSSTALALRNEYGAGGVSPDLIEALYYYALAARQMEIEGLAETVEIRSANFMFARRASLARQLVRAGRSAAVAAVAGRVDGWTPQSP